MLAYSRPFWPLFLHVLGAMVLFGVVLAAIVTSYAKSARASFITLLAALPAWVVAFLGAVWIESKENLPNSPAWLGIGHITLEGGLVVLLLPAVGAAYWWRRSGNAVAGRIVTALSSLYLAALTVALLAMSGKWG